MEIYQISCKLIVIKRVEILIFWVKSPNTFSTVEKFDDSEVDGSEVDGSEVDDSEVDSSKVFLYKSIYRTKNKLIHARAKPEIVGLILSPM